MMRTARKGGEFSRKRAAFTALCLPLTNCFAEAGCPARKLTLPAFPIGHCISRPDLSFQGRRLERAIEAFADLPILGQTISIAGNASLKYLTNGRVSETRRDAARCSAFFANSLQRGNKNEF
jgi:hypothetical protein